MVHRDLNQQALIPFTVDHFPYFKENLYHQANKSQLCHVIGVYHFHQSTARMVHHTLPAAFPSSYLVVHSFRYKVKMVHYAPFQEARLTFPPQSATIRMGNRSHNRTQNCFSRPPLLSEVAPKCCFKVRLFFYATIYRFKPAVAGTTEQGRATTPGASKGSHQRAVPCSGRFSYYHPERDT